MKYYSCPFIEKFSLHFDGRIDKNKKCVALCCEVIKNRPGITFTNNPKKTIKDFYDYHRKIISESIKFQLTNRQNDKKRKYTLTCNKCANYVINDYKTIPRNKISFINLSMYPAPCQCKCVYCNFRKNGDFKFNRTKHSKLYSDLFNVLNYAKKNKLISPNVIWQVSSGEITIHPYKKKILNLIKNQTASFYTNCFIFDKDIAKNLKSNPKSTINLSIDSGNPNTWYKIKGIDNFKTIVNNLTKYSNSIFNPKQITLKYILLPGINDNMTNYIPLIKIIKKLKIKRLLISRDTNKKYLINSKQRKKLIKTASILVYILQKNNILSILCNYTPQEKEKIFALAQKSNYFQKPLFFLKDLIITLLKTH